MKKNSLLLFVLPVALLCAAGCGQEQQRVQSYELTAQDEVFAQIMMLEDQRNPDMDVLLPLLKGDDPVIRRRVALALGRIGLPEVEDNFRLPLEDCLAIDMDPSVRAMAAFALGEAQEIASGPAIEAALADRDPEVRSAAVDAISRMGYTGGSTVPTITGMILNDPSPIVRKTALQQAWRVRAPATAEAARQLIIDGPESDRADATYHLLRWLRLVRPGGFQLGREILDRFTAESDPLIRKYLIGIIAFTGEDDALLAQSLGDEDLHVRINAIRGMAQRNYIDGLSALVPLLDSDTPHIRYEAVRAMGGYAANLVNAPEYEQTIRQRLIDLIDDPAPAVAASAVESLTAIEPAALAEKYESLAADPRIQVRVAAVNLAVVLATEDTPGRVRAALVDNSPVVQMAGLFAWNQIHSNKITPQLEAVLETNDQVLVSVVAGMVADDPQPQFLPLLLKAYNRFRNDPNIEAKTGIIGAVAAYMETDDGLAAMEGMLKDPDRNVRLAAARYLFDKKGEDVFKAVGTYATNRDIEYYRTVIKAIHEMKAARIKTTAGDIKIRFLIEDAPQTVANFLSLVQNGYYNGIIVHRVVPDFVAQAGCPRGDGYGGPGYDIRCELNPLTYDRGTVGMALAGRDTGGSQWFITLSPQPHLNGGYTIFAHVEEGMDVAERLLPGDKINSIELLEE